MVFLDHVQNLHIHAEKTHKDFGAHCMKYVNFVHDPEKQYRSTVPAVRPLSIGLQVTEICTSYLKYSSIHVIPIIFLPRHTRASLAKLGRPGDVGIRMATMK